jgi:hypothetical protein
MKNNNAVIPAKDEKILSSIEELAANLPEDASIMQMLELMAEATGESVETIHQRYVEIKSAKS